MPRSLVFYVSGHGFGHASRMSQVINALHACAPALHVTIRTAAPHWFFASALEAPVAWEPLECDTGVAQIDSLTVDVEATLRDAAAFHATLAERARAEAEAPWLRKASLVVGDIPPLAFAAAHLAGVPAVAIGNFTWDWIYEGYEETTRLAPDLAATVRTAYAHAEVALRLPLHGGFAGFRQVRDVPFIARRSRRDPGEVRARLQLPVKSRLVLASFGGYGVRDLPLTTLGALEGYTVLITASVNAVRRGGQASVPVDATLPRSVRFVDEGELRAQGFAYEDLVAAADVVVTKPGYGIIAEAAANDTAVLYTSRGRFVEYDVLVREMPRYVRAAFIAQKDLLAGRWQAPLDGLLAQTRPSSRADVSGADVVAGLLISAVAR